MRVGGVRCGWARFHSHRPGLNGISRCVWMFDMNAISTSECLPGREVEWNLSNVRFPCPSYHTSPRAALLALRPRGVSLVSFFFKWPDFLVLEPGRSDSLRFKFKQAEWMGDPRSALSISAAFFFACMQTCSGFFVNSSKDTVVFTVEVRIQDLSWMCFRSVGHAFCWVGLLSKAHVKNLLSVPSHMWIRSVEHWT